VQGTGGTVVKISVPALRTPTALAELVRLRRRLRADGDLLRSVVGLGRPGEACFLGVWRDCGQAARFIDEEWVHQAAERWGAGFWAGAWLPENEFGHWDGLRLRQRRYHRGLPRDPSTAAR
jgi:hypothetical protein